MSNNFCKRPFEEIEINVTGEVYTCCPNWNKFYSIGNIYKNSFDEIWNSEKAMTLRDKVKNNDYSLCDMQGCLYLKQQYFDSLYHTNCTKFMNEYPKTVKFVYDYECNIACKICRDHIKRLSDEELSLLNSKIETFFLPLLKGAKVLIINAHGDPFGSRHSRLVIQKAAQKYPDLKFDFHTNGILCNESNFKSLNITPDKISKIRISIHAATKETYGRIVPNGEVLFPKITENLKYLAKIRERCSFPVYIHFVVSSINYREIPQFVDIAHKYNASPRFWEFRQENCSYQMQENLYVVNKDHPLHSDLLKVLKDKRVKRNKDFFSPAIYDLIED